jgi:hypothetical protein
VRQQGLAGTELAQATAGSVRLKLLKVAAQVTRERAAGVGAVEPCLSATEPIPPLSPATEAAGVAERLKKERAEISQSHGVPSAPGKVSSKTAWKWRFSLFKTLLAIAPLLNLTKATARPDLAWGDRA